MAGFLGIYGLIIIVIVSTRINPKAKSYHLFDGYAYFSSNLARGLVGLFIDIPIGMSMMLQLLYSLIFLFFHFNLFSK